MSYKFTGLNVVKERGKNLYVYSIDKEKELLPMNFTGLDEFFAMLDKLGGRGIGHAMILFDGYNETLTELHEIPEVRKFVKELFNRYPYVLNYVNFDLEGHHVLLSSLLDMESIYVGERLTFEEHIQRYGVHVPMPKYSVKLNFPKEKMSRIISSMFMHGNQNNVTKYADNQVRKLLEIFGLGMAQ